MLQAAQSNETDAFLGYLFDGLEGYVYTATILRDPETKANIEFKQDFHRWPEQRAVLNQAISSASVNLDVYVAPAIFDSPSSKKEHFKASNVVWTEFDGQVPTLTGSDVPEPTLRVRSSIDGHEHWYWRLAAPATDRSAVESVTRALAYKLGADASGWDCNQLLRPPGTFNHKRSAGVSILASNEGVVTTTAFDTLPTPTSSVPEEISPDVIPDVTDVMLKYAWAQEFIDLYKKNVNQLADRSLALMNLGYMLAEHGLTDHEMYAVLRNADDRWGKFKDRTDRERRLLDLIARVREKHPLVIDLDASAIPLYGFDTFLNTEVEFDWIVEGFLAEQSYFLLTGPAGVGKTQYSLRWAIALALGRPEFMGYKIERPCRLIFWSLEMGHATLKSFLEIMATTLSAEEIAVLEQNLVIVPLGEPFYVDNAEGQARFESVLAAVKPDGFFFDSLGSSTSGELSSETAVKAVMDWNDRVRQKFGMFSWYIHHNRKAQGDNKKPNKMSDVYGNQYLVNRADSIYCLWPTNGDIEVLNLKNRLAQMEDPYSIARIAGLDFMRKTTIALKSAPVHLTHKAPVEPDKPSDGGTPPLPKGPGVGM